MSLKEPKLLIEAARDLGEEIRRVRVAGLVRARERAGQLEGVLRRAAAAPSFTKFTPAGRMVQRRYGCP